MGAWDKAIDLFTEWVKKEKRWPLALPLSISGVFPFIQKYCDLKFADTVWHWSFLLFCGFVIAISGTFYWLLERKEAHRFWVFLSMLAVGFTFISGGVWQRIPTKPSGDKLVVCITRFISHKPDDDRVAADCQQYMDSHLRKKEKEGVPIVVNRVESQVMGSNDVSKGKFAVSLAKTPAAASHVVLWGDIVHNAEGVFIDPRLTIASSLLGTQLEEKIPLQLFASRQYRFERLACEDVADVVVVVCGLAFWNARAMDKALEIMKTAKSATGYYFQGLLHLLKRDYAQGAEALEKSILKEPENVGALNNLAVAYFFLSRAEDAKVRLNQALSYEKENLAIAHNLGFLQMIMKDFEGASISYKNILAKGDDFESRLNMAFCLFEMGRIDEAVKEWQRAYETCSKMGAVERAKAKASCLDVQAGLAAGLFAKGNSEQAFRLYTEVLESNRDYGDSVKLKSDYFWPEKASQTALEVVKQIKK